MKRFLIIALLFSFQYTYAATGSGNDGILMILSIIGVLTGILLILYSISFIWNYIKKRKQRMAQITQYENNEPIEQSSNQ